MDERGHCKDYLKQFSDYIDGELTPEICTQLEAHLRECSNCRVVLNTLQKTVDLFHVSEGDETLPDEIRLRLFARLKLDHTAEEQRGE